MSAPARKYNPGFLTDEELVASFCVRTTEFDLLVEALRECVGNSNAHQLVIGPRGSGKTSLLLRVAAEIRGDPGLAAGFLPVVFAEESYEVATAGEFWLACLMHLAAQAPQRVDGVDLERTVAELREVRDDRALGERCLGALLDFADRVDRRLVLLAENLDMLFRDMRDADAGWRLRKVLQTEPRIVMVASAVSRFDEIDHPDHALYDLFRIRVLRRLDTAECAALWASVAGRPARAETIRSLEILTGGSPRLIAIVARFGAARSFRDLMADLLDLVDDHTEYFKSHLESLPAQERRVYLSLAMLWRPATAREVAADARMSTSACSAQLARLEERGVVQVAGGSARRKHYYLVERLYNIYYLLRRGRGAARLVEELVRFMESFYSPSELAELAVREFRTESPSVDDAIFSPSVSADHAMDPGAAANALRQSALAALVASPVPASIRDASPASMGAGEGSTHRTQAEAHAGEAVRATPAELAAREACKRVDTLSRRNRLHEALEACEEVVRRFGASDSPAVLKFVARAFVGRGTLLYTLDRPQDALAVFDEAVERFRASEFPEVLPSVATAQFYRGVVLGELGRAEDAIAAYDGVVLAFGASDAPELLVLVAKSLVNKGSVLGEMNRRRSAVAVYDDVIRRFSESPPPIVDSLALALANKGSALFALDRPEDALAACDEAIRRFGESTESEVMDSVMNALTVKGSILAHLDRPEAALEVYDEVVRRAGDDGTLPPAPVAVAMLNRALAFLTLARHAEALNAANDVLNRFGGVAAEDPLVSDACAHAVVVKGTALGELDRSEEALAVFDDAIERYAGEESTEIPEGVAIALLNREVTLRSSRPSEALATCNEVVRLFGDSRDPALMKSVATALIRKNFALCDLNRHADAMVACDETVTRFADSADPALLKLVAEALRNKVFALETLGRREDTLAVYDEIVHRFGDGRVPSLLASAANALLDKACALGSLGRREEHLAACDELVRRFGESEAPPLIETVAAGMHLKALALGELGQFDEMLVVCDEVIRRFEESESLSMHERVADALVRRGVALAGLNLEHGALATFDEAVSRFGDSESPAVLEAVANALMNKATALGRLNRSADALAVHEEVVRRFGESEALALRRHAAGALATLGGELGLLGREREALAASDEAVRRFGNSDDVGTLESVAFALLNKGNTLARLNRTREALAVYDEMVERFAEHDRDPLRCGVSEALLAKAWIEYAEGLYEAAAATAGRVTDAPLGASPEQQLRGHAIAAKARLQSDARQATDADAEAVLTLLAGRDVTIASETARARTRFSWGRFGKEPDAPSGAGEAAVALLAFSVDLGPQRILDLIQASESGHLLSPLATVLEWELGEEPRVAREVEEVASDIREVLRSLRTDRTNSRKAGVDRTC